MERKTSPKLIFICPYCEHATRHIPICGVFSDRAAAMYPVGLCTQCGPLHLELLMLCRQAAAGIGLN